MYPPSSFRFADWGIALGLLVAIGCGVSGDPSRTLLNASYDPTRELWLKLNSAFTQQYNREHEGQTVRINQSHGGSSSQARAIADGLEADVATLGLWLDTDALRQRGLVAEGWESRMPHGSTPYYSTIVFVVRKGNPKEIKSWPDLIKPGVEVITPNPKTGGNGKLAFLAAWGSVLKAGGTDDDAREFVTALYRQVPVLDASARAATSTFSQKEIGDVHLTWENEAHLEVREAKGALEIVYPPLSIRADPPVVVVDKYVEKHGTRDLAEAYLKFAFTPEGQRIIAENFYRPIDETVAKETADMFPKIDLFPLEDVVKDWHEAQRRFFADGGEFDKIYATNR